MYHYKYNTAEYNTARNRRAVRLAALCALFIAVFALAVYAEPSPLRDGSGAPPFTALSGESGLPYDIGFYSAGGEDNYLFLPSFADVSALSFRYDGGLEAYDPASGKNAAPGTSVSAEMTGGKLYLYEYDAGEGTYIRHSADVMRGGDLPSVYITLDGGDDALRRINTSKENDETGFITVLGAGGDTVYSGGMTRMSGHGNTSYEASGRRNTKNSYNINIADKAELVPGAGKSRKWTLLRIRAYGSYDPTGMSYTAAFDTWNALIGKSGADIGSTFADVYIDGDYRGVYVLTERMDINGAMRVTDLEKKTDMPSHETRRVYRDDGDDPAMAAGIKSYSYAPDSSVPEGTDITGGYVLEVMCGWYGECGFQTANDMFINIKSPRWPTKEMVQYIAGYVQQFENALFSETGYNGLGKHYTEYIDEDSWAAQTLVYAFYLNWEIYRTSTYLTKDVGDVIRFGPVWDFESGPDIMYDKTLFGEMFAYNDVPQQHCWFEQAWRKGGFMSRITEKNARLREIIDRLLGKAEGSDIAPFDESTKALAASQDMNWIRWGQPGTFGEWAAAYKAGLEARYETWFEKLWNPDKYLLGLTAEGKDNGDGSWTLTGEVRGKMESDYLIWCEIQDDDTKGVVVDKGESVTVPAGGRYYARVLGRNNAYWQYAHGKIFGADTIVMASDIIDSVPVEAAETSAETASAGTPDGGNKGMPAWGWVLVFAAAAAVGAGIGVGIGKAAGKGK